MWLTPLQWIHYMSYFSPGSVHTLFCFHFLNEQTAQSVSTLLCKLRVPSLGAVTLLEKPCTWIKPWPIFLFPISFQSFSPLIVHMASFNLYMSTILQMQLTVANAKLIIKSAGTPDTSNSMIKCQYLNSCLCLQFLLIWLSCKKVHVFGYLECSRKPINDSSLLIVLHPQSFIHTDRHTHSRSQIHKLFKGFPLIRWWHRGQAPLRLWESDSTSVQQKWTLLFLPMLASYHVFL